MLQSLLEEIVKDNRLHAKWLNSLSYMENCGARKISKCEHAVEVDIMVLKHAAEEHRHAYYLKKMIERVDKNACPTYNDNELLGQYGTRHYLHKLDVFTSKYLIQELTLSSNELKYAAYLLVTYAIEVRADDLYPIYQSVLKSINSKISVYNIIKEEEGHLEEMISSLEHSLPNWREHASVILNYEKELFQYWIETIEKEVIVPA
tara:strand:+ start:4260 stop:4874 length:615 start_codon:yes stop_codon:yes gene_type:complete